eukprot:1621086-Amphidinium_carterae.1
MQVDIKERVVYKLVGPGRTGQSFGTELYSGEGSVAKPNYSYNPLPKNLTAFDPDYTPKTKQLTKNID